MFKPVSGAELSKFDAETIQMYRRRDNDPRLNAALLNLPRRARNHLPIVTNPNDPTAKQYIEDGPRFAMQYAAMCGFFMFAANQFSKIYFPYGIILRRSIPQTWNQYVAHRAPIGLFFLAAWYYQREYPRSQRLDLTCSSEK